MSPKRIRGQLGIHTYSCYGLTHNGVHIFNNYYSFQNLICNMYDRPPLYNLDSHMDSVVPFGGKGPQKKQLYIVKHNILPCYLDSVDAI